MDKEKQTMDSPGPRIEATISELTYRPIGTISTCFPEKFGTPRQSGLVTGALGTIVLNPEMSLRDGLDGLEKYSHLWILFSFHRNDNKSVKTKVHPPRMEGEKIGVFATRSPHRPNSIGLSVVKIENVDQARGEILVSGVDVVDGTPILDIKPYLKSADSIPSAVGGWADAKPVKTLSVEWTLEARGDLEKYDSKERETLASVIAEILELDPRPVAYRGTSDSPNPYTSRYGFFLKDLNVVYSVFGATARVERLQPREEFLQSRRNQLEITEPI